MRVSLDSIPPQGLTVTVGAWAVRPCAEGLEGDDAACDGRLLVTRHGVHVLVRGELHGAATCGCDRCGEPLRFDVTAPLVCVYSPVDALPERDGEDDDAPPLPPGLPVAEAELGEYDGVALELADVVRETFALERPARLRCADVLGADADGACLARWRARAGAAPADRVDPRFAVLSSFKSDS